MSALGAVRFAQYAYPPNELGYCGPPGARVMLAPEAVDEIGRRARLFDGAWAYLELIAAVTGSDDPLSAEVVDAYWLGSDLLAAVQPKEVVAHLEDRFRGQLGGSWRDAAERAVPHHSFQVFEVYPWARLLLDGKPPGPAVQVLDRCRIRVGEVVGVDDEEVDVVSRPLHWDGHRLAEGDAVAERARWSVGGQSLIETPVVGSTVALHWDWVCDEITPAQGRLVRELERGQLAALF